MVEQAAPTIQQLAARIRPYVVFTANGVWIDVRKWLAARGRG